MKNLLLPIFITYIAGIFMAYSSNVCSSADIKLAATERTHFGRPALGW